MIGYPLNIANEEDTLGLIDEILNATGRLDVWVCSSGLLGPSSIDATTPADLQKCFEANSMAPFFALKYGPPAMAKLAIKRGNYSNAAPKDQKYGSIIVVSSVASTYGGEHICPGAGSCESADDQTLVSAIGLHGNLIGCWGPCYTMSSHAALGVVRSGVAVLKGKLIQNLTRELAQFLLTVGCRYWYPNQLHITRSDRCGSRSPRV